MNIEDYLISPDDTIRSTMKTIQKTGSGIALVVDGDRQLLDTVTDGDIRRGLIEGYDMDMPIHGLLACMEELLKRHGPVDWVHHVGNPLKAGKDTPAKDLLELMTLKKRRHIPLVDDSNRVVDLALWGDLAGEEKSKLRAVVMAGGLGSRLAPLTDDTPKPMLPIGDRPLMEHIINQFRSAGIKNVNISVRHLREQIVSHFGDGSNFGVSLDYIDEDEPLGTAGALGNLTSNDETLLVINGDILTRVDFNAMFTHHRENDAALTLAVRKYEIAVPYGVVKCQGANVIGLEEKPTVKLFVNAGIYLLEQKAKDMIPAGQPFDMTDLIQLLLDSGQTVSRFLVHEYWLDVGKIDDYRQAQDDFKIGKID